MIKFKITFIMIFSLILNSYEIILVDWILLSNKTLSGETDDLLTVELGRGSVSSVLSPLHFHAWLQWTALCSVCLRTGCVSGYLDEIQLWELMQHFWGWSYHFTFHTYTWSFARNSLMSLYFHCCCSVAKLYLTLCDPVNCSLPSFLSFLISQSLLKLMFI